MSSHEIRCHFCNKWIDFDVGNKWMPQSSARLRRWQAANTCVPAAAFQSVTRKCVCHRHFGEDCFDANGKLLTGLHIIPTKLHEGLNINLVGEPQDEEEAATDPMQPSTSYGTVSAQLESRLVEGHTSTPRKRPSASRLQSAKCTRLTPPPLLSAVSTPDAVLTPSDAGTPQAPPLSLKKRLYCRDDECTRSNESSRDDVLEKVADPDFERLSSSGGDTTFEELPNRKELNKLNERVIVDSSCLLQLFSICSSCGEALGGADVTVTTAGTGITVQWQCGKLPCLKSGQWCSQTKLSVKPEGGPDRKVYAGNVDFCAAVPLSCTTYACLAKFSRAMNLRIPSENSFYQYQREFVNPAVHELMESQIKVLHAEMKERDMVELSMDGRYSSVGHTADKCTVTTMDPVTNKVILTKTMSLLPKSDPNYTASSNMEVKLVKESLETLLDSLDKKVSVLCTDGSTSITGLMKRTPEFAQIKHTLDPWHAKKTLEKKFLKMVRPKMCSALQPWQRKFTSHFLYCCQVGAVSRNPDLAVEYFQSFYFHIQRVHKWSRTKDPYGDKFKHIKRCSHDPIDKEHDAKTPYLRKGDPALQALKKMLWDSKTVAAVKKCCENVSSSNLESLHALMRMFAPKRLRFQEKQYLTRIYLAIMHYNENVGRPMFVNRDGEPVYYIRTRKTRSGPHPAVQQKASQLSFDYVHDVMENVRATWRNKNLNANYKLSEQTGAPLEKFVGAVEVDEEIVMEEFKRRQQMKVRDQEQLKMLQVFKLEEFRSRKAGVPQPVDPDEHLLAEFMQNDDDDLDESYEL